MVSGTTSTSHKGDDHTICLSDDILYNVINEGTTADLWYRLENLYMMKSLSKKLVKEALHEEAVIHPSDEGRYIYSISKCFQYDFQRLVGSEGKARRRRQSSSILLFSSIKL